MLFFLMTFAMTRMTDTDRQAVSRSVETAFKDRAAMQTANEERLMKQKKEENAISSLAGSVNYGSLYGYADMTSDEKEIKIVLRLPVFFASGSAEIIPEARPSLESLASALREFPNNIVIEGHTDNVPIRGGFYGSNWELSVARAVSVIDFFVSKGLSPEQFVAGGYGEYHQAFPNDTDEHRARNRRIEISIARRQET